MLSKLKREQQLQEINERRNLLLTQKDAHLYQQTQLKDIKQEEENLEIFKYIQEHKQIGLHQGWVDKGYSPNYTQNQIFLEKLFGQNCFGYCFIKLFCCLKRRENYKQLDYDVTNLTIEDFEGIFNSFLIISTFLFGFQLYSGQSYSQEEYVKGDENYWYGHYNSQQIQEKEELGELLPSQQHHSFYLTSLSFLIISIIISLGMIISLYFSSSRKNAYITHLWVRQFTWLSAIVFVMLIFSVIFILFSNNLLFVISHPYYCWDRDTKLLDDDGNILVRPAQNCSNYFEEANKYFIGVIIVITFIFLIYIYLQSMNLQTTWSCFQQYRLTQLDTDKRKAERQKSILYPTVQKQLYAWLESIDLTEYYEHMIEQEITLEQLAYLNRQQQISGFLEKLNITKLGDQAKIMMSLGNENIFEQFDLDSRTQIKSPMNIQNSQQIQNNQEQNFTEESKLKIKNINISQQQSQQQQQVTNKSNNAHSLKINLSKVQQEERSPDHKKVGFQN